MPIHDWVVVEPGIFHHFHGEWIHAIGRALNNGLLPPDYYALTEQVGIGVAPDVIALRNQENDPPGARKKNQVAVRHVSDDKVVAVIEIVSPGNKGSRNALRALLDKSVDLLTKGVHLLVIDLFPPTKRDTHGVHAAIQEELAGTEFVPPDDKPLTLASYQAVAPPVAYVEPVAVGDVLPDMPLFLVPGGHVLVPLEKTYSAAWEGVPARWRKAIDPTGA